jgi:hypothetical protein
MWLAVNDSVAIMFVIQPAKSLLNPMIIAVRIAMQDAAAFHSALAIYASVWASTQGSGLQLETIYHKAECVRIVNSRLNGHEPPSDGTIHAVIWLWALEVRTHKSYKTLIAS